MTIEPFYLSIGMNAEQYRYIGQSFPNNTVMGTKRAAEDLGGSSERLKLRSDTAEANTSPRCQPELPARESASVHGAWATG